MTDSLSSDVLNRETAEAQINIPWTWLIEVFLEFLLWKCLTTVHVYKGEFHLLLPVLSS